MPIRLTQSVKFLLGLCFATFILQQTADQFFGAHLAGVLALSPSRFLLQHAFWQPLTYSFVHSDVVHLFFNLLMLASIGSELEAIWGKARFLRYYFFCTFATAAVFILAYGFSRGAFPAMAGSSGPIYGLLLAYGLIFGDRVMLFMMLFPMKAKHFVGVLALIELLTTLYSSGGLWAGFAQLMGMAAGLAYLLLGKTFHLREKKSGSKSTQTSSRTPARKKKSSQHLKLVVSNQDSFEDTSGQDPKTWH